jgi:hypothetical protein
VTLSRAETTEKRRFGAKRVNLAVETVALRGENVNLRGKYVGLSAAKVSPCPPARRPRTGLET